MSKAIHIYAQIAKTSVDVKKTTVTLDLDFDSMDKAPVLADITGQTCAIDIWAEDGGDDEE